MDKQSINFKTERYFSLSRTKFYFIIYIVPLYTTNRQSASSKSCGVCPNGMPCFFSEPAKVSVLEPKNCERFISHRNQSLQDCNKFRIPNQNASTNRSSPATVNNAQPPNHTTERRSPLVISNSTLSPQIQSNVINAQSLGVLRTSSPVPSSSNSGTAQDDGLKITYEKQPNSRVAQLQEESTPVGRRSR